MGKALGLLLLSSCLTLQVGCSKKQSAAKNAAARRQKVSQAKTTPTPALPAQQEAPVAPTPEPQVSTPSPAATPPASVAAPAAAQAPAPSTSSGALDSLKTPPAQTLSTSPAGSAEATSAEAPKAEEKKEQTKPAVEAEVQKGAWRLSDIKILMYGTLEAAQKGGLLVVADNGLRTHQRATMDQANAAQGIMCSMQMSQGLKNGDVLKYVNTEMQKDPNDKVVTLINVQYKTDDNKQIVFLCKARGEITEVHFKENMEKIVDFRNDKGGFDSDNQKDQDPRVVDAKTRTFKITNVEAMKAINVHLTGEDNSNAVVEGKIVPAKDSMSMIYTNRARAACQIASYKGEMKANVVYKRTDTEISANDETRGVAVITYLYEPEGPNKEEDFIGITCMIRKSAPVHYIFNTFKGVLEFFDPGTPAE